MPIRPMEVWRARHPLFSWRNVSQLSDPVCAICLSDVRAASPERVYAPMLPCGHTFHRSCIRRFAEHASVSAYGHARRIRCPLCRHAHTYRDTMPEDVHLLENALRRLRLNRDIERVVKARNIRALLLEVYEEHVHNAPNQQPAVAAWWRRLTRSNIE